MTDEGPDATPSPGPLFFVHVMKTGGSTFRQRMVRQLGREAVFPCAPLDPPALRPNADVRYLAGLSPQRLAGIRAFSGHFPFFATELVPPPSHVLSVLRDPVERAISFLKQHHRDRGLGAERSLESIYDLEWHRTFHITNYQVRVFATTLADDIGSVMHYVDIDDDRIEVAKDHLRRVDILGLHERYDEFVTEAVRRLGWSEDEVPSRRVSTPTDVPSSLRRRIAADNQRDLEFYEFARELYEERRRERGR